MITNMLAIVKGKNADSVAGLLELDRFYDSTCI